MNEQAFDDLYKEFVRTGYRKSKEDFKILMSTNLDAFTDGFNQFVNTGYNGDESAFAELIGVEVPVKKKKKLKTLLRICHWQVVLWSQSSRLTPTLI